MRRPKLVEIVPVPLHEVMYNMHEKYLKTRARYERSTDVGFKRKTESALW